MHGFSDGDTERQDEALTTVATMLARSSYAVALTGAGISKPSGIPDFRSPDSGLWERYDPLAVASLSAFRQHPERFYDWVRPLLETTRSATPNPAHHALTELQELGCLHEIITQNIDGLHAEAGSRDVLPVHGHTRTATCMACDTTTDAEPLWEVVMAGDVPTCDRCGGLLKPDVILFGELLPPDVLDRARTAAARADFMLVAGSSLEVSPAADLPFETLQNGGTLVIVNLGPTQLDHEATVKIEGDVAEVLPTLVERVREVGA